MILRAFVLAWFQLSAALAGDHHHEHKAPHGGALVELGEHAAHVELLLEPKSGKLTLWVLDAGAEKGVRIKQKEIELKISIDLKSEPAAKKTYSVTLKGIANPLTGETEEDTSEFSVLDEKLKHQTRFGVVISRIAVKGQEYKEVSFDYPKGKEGP